MQIIVASGRGEVQAVRRNVLEIAEMDIRGGGAVGQSGEREGGHRGASKSNNRYERKHSYDRIEIRIRIRITKIHHCIYIYMYVCMYTHI